MLSLFELTSALLVLSALFGFLNRTVLRLPNPVGLLLLGLFASLVLVGLGLVFPQVRLSSEIEQTLRQIDFTSLIFQGFLAFLLFASALNVNLAMLRRRWLGVAYLAIFATAISTLITGWLFFLAAGWLGLPVNLPWAMVFGALISPTDPVGVVSLLKSVRVPEDLKTEAEGEALFNDGVGVVLFTLIVGFAAGYEPFSWTALGLDFLREAVGGAAIGILGGILAHRALQRIEDFSVEVLITLALVTGTYAIAQRLGASGPIATVSAGLVLGYRGPVDDATKGTAGHVSALWTLIDEVLNAVLFLLIGLEAVVLGTSPNTLIVTLVSIPVVLLARLVAVSVPLLVPIGLVRRPSNIPFLTWAAIRGGVSIALALALPPSPATPVIVTATYGVVLFSIIGQGLSLGLVTRWLGLDRAAQPAAQTAPPSTSAD